MKTRVLSVLVAISSLVLGAGISFADPPQWQKDPDSTVDPAALSSVIAQLVAPDATIGDADLAVVGVGSEPVGVDDLTIESAPTSSSSSMSSSTIFVDDTPFDADCPPTTYTSIQAAVNASGPGDTIKVCPGTYTEQVRINGHNHDGLRLESVKPLQAIIKWPTIELPPLALVDVNTADRVSVRGFKITGPFTFPGCSPDRHEGVLVEQAFNARITRNWITLIQNSDPLLFGCQEGDAVAIGRRSLGTQPGSAQVDQNRIDEYQKNGVQAVNSGTSLHADHNIITASANPAIHAITASNGVVVFRMAAAIVDHNVITKNKFTPPVPSSTTSTGIILDEAPSGSSRIDHNLIFDNDVAIETDTQTGLEISHNGVFRNVVDGIDVCGDALQGCGPATGIVLRSNDIQKNGGVGIFLLGADNNLLKSNHVDRNGTAGPDTTDGIRVDSGSTGNLIVANHLAGNVTHDCHDDSIGAGTGGTANNWKDNHGQTENRLGLCEAKHDDDGDDDD